MRKWLTTSSFFRQFITHIRQKLDLLILHRAIQRHTQPMGLIHVPAGEDARFLTEGANQSGIAFEIHNTDFIIAGQSQILSGDIHNDGKPLPVPIVPEHQKAGILALSCYSASQSWANSPPAPPVWTNRTLSVGL